ncbi:unnamed protein product [Boreogadus saida]
MEILARLFPYAKTLAGLKRVFEQTQANQTRLQHRGAPRMPFVAVALGLMGISMSGYSSCQLTLHYRPANHLFKGAGRTAAHLQNAHTDSPLV